MGVILMIVLVSGNYITKKDGKNPISYYLKQTLVDRIKYGIIGWLIYSLILFTFTATVCVYNGQTWVYCFEYSISLKYCRNVRFDQDNNSSVAYVLLALGWLVA